ncbi:CHAD domain-containing protein [Microbulbifer hainanensis]|uniref:CHAD domain-containing protein n=1 Tax=Microbulbifer hainanensis TaxID=2735675 RepID=UPI0018662364|nr:CHAD domain-containing protein [Microbulbifer hainanensis]
MAYQLDGDITLPATLHKTARWQLAAAQRDFAELSEEEAVHALRKHCKKMRALLRLVRRDIGDLYAEENAHYRELANSLSGSRDAVSIRDALLTLASAEEFPDIMAFLESRVAHGADPQAMEQAAEQLRQGAARVDGWPLESLDWPCACKGYRRGYRRARKAMKRALKNETAAEFHEYRKRVKDHWYHTRLLEKKYPRALRGRRKPLKELAQALGDWRDLTLLCELLRQNETVLGAELAPLLKRAKRQHEALRETTERLGRDLFVEKSFTLKADSR